jgi:hypothetical protein
VHAYGKFDDEGNNPVKNPNIYDIEGDNRLSPGLQPMTTVSVLKTVFFLKPKLFSHLLQNKTFRLEYFRYNKIVIAFI